MKRIVKGAEPEELRRWKEANAETPQNLIYQNMPTAPVKLQMLSEQGHLCAYTMQAIPTLDDCHIEHVIPQNQPNQTPHLDINCSNMLACVPGKKRSPNWTPQYPYGAVCKGGLHIDANNFISPLQEDVENRFHYAYDGSVATSANDNAADSTVRILKLNHSQLVDLRKAAIEERVLDLDPPLSAADAEALAIEIMARDSRGKFPAFCLAISQVAAWYAHKKREMD